MVIPTIYPLCSHGLPLVKAKIEDFHSLGFLVKTHTSNIVGLHPDVATVAWEPFPPPHTTIFIF